MSSSESVSSEEEQEDKTMLLGEYFLHIFVEETSSLFTGDGQGDMDIVIEVEAFGDTKKTDKKEGIVYGTSAFYGEHFFFDKKFKERAVISSELVRVKVYNSKFFKTLIGSTEFSASSIYYEDNHTFHHRWFFLSNVNKDYQKIMGYIKLSANLTRENEKKHLLKPESSSQIMKGQSIREISIPPQFKLEKKQIQVNIYEADRLFLMDDHWTQGQGSDPYVKLHLGGSEVKTEYLSIKGIKTPMYWKLYMTLIYPTFMDNLTLSLKDHETGVKSNEYFGSERFSVEKINSGKYVHPFWCYIYGGPEYYEHGKIKKKMDQYPEIASTFKGAIYMSIKMIDAVSNNNFRKKMKQEEVLRPPPKRKFKIRVEFYSVQNFHYEDMEDTGPHYMEINWGGKMVGSDKKDINYNLLEFYQYVELEESFSCRELEELPDIIISLTRNSFRSKDLRRVCYCRLRPEDYISQEKMSDKYIFLNIDKSVCDVADDGSGILHFKLGVNATDKWTPSQAQNFNPKLERPKPNRIIVAVNAFQAKELPPGDDHGSSDPVVEVYHYGTRQRSSISLHTLNPVWNESIILATYAIGQFIPPVIINVHDYDPDTDSDKPKDLMKSKGTYQFLGNTCIFIGKKHRVRSLNQIPEPEWHGLKYSAESKMGKISLSVTLSLPESNHFGSYVKKMRQEMDKHLVKIRILGMRNLQSTGIIPVKKPYIRINTTSMILQAGSSEDIPYAILETVPKQGGRNPNIGEIMNMEVDLPIEDSLKPTISCQVLDQALYGSKKKIIGSFEIDVGFYSFYSKISLNQRLNLLKKMLQKENKRLDAIPILERIIQELSSTISRQGSRMLKVGVIKQDVALLNNNKTSVASQIASYMAAKPGKGSKNHSEQQFKPDSAIQSSNTQINNILELSDAKTSKIVEFNSRNDHNRMATEPSKDDIVMPKVRDESETIAPRQANFENYQDNIIVIKPKYKRMRLEDAEQEEEKKDEEEDEELANLKSGSKGRFILKEYNIPDLEKYRAVGHDSAKRKAKHYRLKLETSLEKSEFIGKSEFDSIDIIRGKRIKEKKSFIAKIFGSKDQFKRVGMFKGGISCMSMKMLNALQKLNLDDELDKYNIPYSKKGWENRQIDKDMLQKVKVQTRIYILEARLFKSEDRFSKNDPFLKITLGEDEYDGRDEFLSDRDFAIFNKRIIFDHEFPGSSVLKVSVFDRDIAFDDMLGETEIDLEERFYDEKFRAMPEQPIERRKLYMMDSGQETGYIDLWVETFAKRQKGDGIKEIEPIMWDISSAPAQEFELRIVVWDVRNVPNDDPEDMSDIYVKVALNSLDNDLNSSTDTHIRAADGFGSFNWRMKFPIKINAYSFRPEEREKFRIDFQIWDKDLASFNDYLSSITIPFFHLIEEASASNSKAVMQMKTNGNSEFDFYLKTRPNDKLEDENLKKESKIRVSVDLVPKEMADMNPVGFGRGPPNNSPYLPEPVGRFKMTMNPFKLIDRLVGPAFKRKCCLYSCCICYCFLFIMLLPIIMGNILTSMIT